MQQTKSLGADDLDRLSRLLGMLGSNHDGEVLAAGRFAHRLIRERGLCWPDLIRAPSLPPPEPPPDDWPDALRDWPENWPIAIRLCQAAAAVLPPKDVAFLATICGYQHKPSAAQIGWLRNIVDRARAGRRP